MKPEQFAYWLQGFVELNRGAAPDAAQWKSICEHLGTVFEKVTPAVAPGPIVAAPATPGNDPLKPRPGTVFPQISDLARMLEDAQRTHVGPGLLGPGVTITC